MEPADPAFLAYESFAPIYDDFTYRNDYEMWFGVLLPALERLGLRTGRLLDVACGTGRAFEPMLRRGWEIMACDISPAMLERAAANAPEGVGFEVCDMRELPVLGAFELVWALNDPVNYVLDRPGLDQSLRAMAANLADDGLLVFDCNTARVFDSEFAVSTSGSELMSVGEWSWRGLGEVDERVYEAELSGAGVETHLHRERHWLPGEIRTALLDAGLEPLAALGQSEAGGVLQLADEPDEERDEKIVHVARRP